MPMSITRSDVLRLVDEAAELIEVLPLEEYEWAHIRGARWVPLEAIDGGGREVLDPARPIITSCNNFE